MRSWEEASCGSAPLRRRHRGPRPSARPILSELERWRLAGGRLELGSLTLAKGSRRAEAKGSFGLDDLHRVQGQVDLSVARVGGLLGRLTGTGGIGGLLLGALLGSQPADRQPERNDRAAALKPLPQIRLEGGRLHFGPLAIPGFRLTPLY